MVHPGPIVFQNDPDSILLYHLLGGECTVNGAKH